MAIYPGAELRLLPRTFARATVRNRVTFHTAVTDADSLYPVFARGGPASHFYVGEHGEVEQYIDTDRHSAADLDGNDATISIETWDGYKAGAPGFWRDSSDVPPWTDAQLVALEDLTRWLLATHDIPARLATDSRIGASSRGLAWHRLGVESHPPGRPGYRVPDGMRWSTALGKACPGDRRIAQIPGILAAITTPARPSGQPVRAPLPTVQEDDMTVILNKATNAAIIVSGGRSAPIIGWDMYVTLSKTLPSVAVSNEQFAAFVAAFPLAEAGR